MAKQNKIKLYAKALAEVLDEKKISEEKIIKNFLALLKKENLEKKAKEILNLAEDIILKKQGKKKVVLESARRLTPENRALLKSFVKEGDVVKEKVNHNLIAGVKIILNNEKQLDMSLKNKLEKIFN